MRLFHALIFCVTFSLRVFSQMEVESIKTTSLNVGLSAISINTLVAKVYQLPYPLYDYQADTLTRQLIFSGRQTGEGTSTYLSRGFFGAISSADDEPKWVNESSLYDVRISGNNLLLSNEVRSVRYNKLRGYDEIRYDSKLIYTVPKYNRGFMYDRSQDQVLHCVNLTLGTSTWSCSIPRTENWVDTRALNDSVVLIAASGLHAVNIRTGLLWSFPLSTAVRTNRSFVYSNAKYTTVQKVSTVIKTSAEDNLVTQIASNILVDDSRIYFASREKMIALNHRGQLLWQLDLKNYPTSKMLITRTDSSLSLVNFGLATHSNNFVTWGRPFIITIQPSTGRIVNQNDLGHIENLADFIKTDDAFIFAGKGAVQEARPGKADLKTLLTLSPQKYGEFVEFINGDEYYTFKEGYYVPLNFINDKVNYFRADNNKIYGIEEDQFKYEYHYTELFRLNKKYKNRTFLYNDKKTLITSNNFELLFTIDLSDRNVILDDKLYFMGEASIYMLDLKALK
jgi:hypothetical protein